MKTVMQPEYDPMPSIARNKAQIAVNQLGALMSEISEELMDSTQKYKSPLVAQGDGNALLQVLQHAGLPPSN